LAELYELEYLNLPNSVTITLDTWNELPDNIQGIIRNSYPGLVPRGA
jgi:hypothetical protein